MPYPAHLVQQLRKFSVSIFIVVFQLRINNPVWEKVAILRSKALNRFSSVAVDRSPRVKDGGHRGDSPRDGDKPVDPFLSDKAGVAHHQLRGRVSQGRNLVMF